MKAKIRKIRISSGFTLVELLIAMVVTSIILSAVGTLAYAFSSANSSTKDVSRNQAIVRCASLQISELIKNARLICGTVGDDLAIWRADDNNDNLINPSELVYFESGSQQNYIRILQFSSNPNWSVQLTNIQNGIAKPLLKFSCQPITADLIPECSNVLFTVSNSEFVNLSFDMAEAESWHNYQIAALSRCSADNLLASASTLVSGDDD